jgi:hypothetical protein
LGRFALFFHVIYLLCSHYKIKNEKNEKRNKVHSVHFSLRAFTFHSLTLSLSYILFHKPSAMAKKRKFAPGVWKEEAFRESTTDASDTNETQVTDDTGGDDNNGTTIATVVAEPTHEEDDNLETPEKKQKIENGDGDGE